MYSSVYFLLISSSFLLKFLLCSSILFPYSVNILITHTLNSLPGKWLFLFHHLNFQRFSLALSIENSSSVFPCYFSFSVSMDLSIGGAATHNGLTGASSCGSVLSSVCGPRALAGELDSMRTEVGLSSGCAGSCRLCKREGWRRKLRLELRVRWAVRSA